MLHDLKIKVCEANKQLKKNGLVTLTWGNASAIDRDNGVVIIKPSGVDYALLTVNDMVIVDMCGNIVEGNLKPSSDLDTHLVLYKQFPNVGGIVHTHSKWATIWSQMGIGIQPYGTTHADYFYGEIPCTRKMLQNEIATAYEQQTGNVIVERFLNINYEYTPAVLVHNHGPFCWGKNIDEAVQNAVVLEEVAFMAWHSTYLTKDMTPMQTELMEKHFFRKHGKNSYYGQT